MFNIFNNKRIIILTVVMVISSFTSTNAKALTGTIDTGNKSSISNYAGDNTITISGDDTGTLKLTKKNDGATITGSSSDKINIEADKDVKKLILKDLTIIGVNMENTPGLSLLGENVTLVIAGEVRITGGNSGFNKGNHGIEAIESTSSILNIEGDGHLIVNGGYSGNNDSGPHGIYASKIVNSNSGSISATGGSGGINGGDGINANYIHNKSKSSLIAEGGTGKNGRGGNGIVSSLGIDDNSTVVATGGNSAEDNGGYGIWDIKGKSDYNSTSFDAVSAEGGKGKRMEQSLGIVKGNPPVKYPLGEWQGTNFVNIKEISRNDETRARIEFSSTKSGSYYYLLKPSDSTTLTNKEEVKLKGIKNEMLWMENTIEIENLSGFSYDLYLLTENYQGIIGNMMKISIPQAEGYINEEEKPIIKKQKIKGVNFHNKTVSSKAFYLGQKSTGGGKLTYSSNNKNVAVVSNSGKVTIKGIGKATIRVKAAGITGKYYSVKKNVAITVTPNPLLNLKIKTKKRSMTVSWRKDSAVTGYQITYSLDKNFKKSVKKVDVRKNIEINKSINKLKKGKTYYVKARSVKKVGHEWVYSPYSSVKKIKVR